MRAITSLIFFLLGFPMCRITRIVFDLKLSREAIKVLTLLNGMLWQKSV